MEYISCGDEMNRVREVMKEKGLTQKDLQAVTGIDQAALSRIINERNRRSITLDTCKRISKALGYPIEYIWPD